MPGKHQEIRPVSDTFKTSGKLDEPEATEGDGRERYWMELLFQRMFIAYCVLLGVCVAIAIAIGPEVTRIPIRASAALAMVSLIVAINLSRRRNGA